MLPGPIILDCQFFCLLHQFGIFGIKWSQTSQVGKQEHAVCCLLSGFLHIHIQFIQICILVTIQSLKSCPLQLYVKVEIVPLRMNERDCP